MDLLLLCRAESEAMAQGLLEGGRGWPLTATGRLQADRLGARLAREYCLTALYASTLEEAWETAGRVGGALDLAPQPEPDLREVDSGRLAGQPVAQVSAAAAARFPPHGDIFSPLPGGESYVAMHLRVVKAFNRLVEGSGGQTIALVTHPGPIQAFLLAFLRYAIEQRVELNLRCDPASLHHLRRGADGRKEIVRLNDTGHLVDW